MSDVEELSDVECLDVEQEHSKRKRVRFNDSRNEEEGEDASDNDDDEYRPEARMKLNFQHDDAEKDSDDDSVMEDEGVEVPDPGDELDEEGNKVVYEKEEVPLNETRKQRIQRLRDARMEEAVLQRRCLDLKSINNIRNKVLKRQEMQKYVKHMKKAKKLERKQRKKAGVKTEMRTIENTREPDITMVGDLADDNNAEIAQDIATDEFSEYFKGIYEPKVLVTFSDNPSNKTRAFGFELCRTIPNSVFRLRNRSRLKQAVTKCVEAGFTDMVIINEDKREPNGMVVIHLPNGPTAHFRLSNVKTTKALNRDFKGINTHRPEVILNNFDTRLGVTVGRMLASLFHYDPEFKGRRAVTFHNQRDYIFFRNHRYEFKSNKKVSLRELGPQFTLRLRSLQQGTFDTKTGEYIWIINNRRHAMETNRRTFFL